jgi:hypothetical protein
VISLICGFILAFWALVIFLTFYEALRGDPATKAGHKGVVQPMYRAALLGALVVDIVVLGWWLNS